jgi:hypothetical protein
VRYFAISLKLLPGEPSVHELTFCHDLRGNIPHLTTSDRTARIPSMYYNGAGDWLKSGEVIQDNARTKRKGAVSRFALSLAKKIQDCSGLIDKPHENNLVVYPTRPHSHRSSLSPPFCFFVFA